MNIEEVISKLKEKYNYNEGLLNFLHKAINGMIIYYGEENKDKIFNTFITTPIGFYQTQDDVNKFYTSIGISKVENMPIVASGGYLEKFQINDNNQLERIPSVLIKNTGMESNENNEYYETIIHEYCHAFMNYGKFSIDGNKITTSTGLIKSTITFDNGIETYDEKHTAIEEGMNDYDAINITKLIFGKAVGSKVYERNVKYVSMLMDDDCLRQIINSSRINGDNEWKKILGDELSDRFLNSFENYWSAFFGENIPFEEKQQNSSNSYAGFYMYDESNVLDAYHYAEQENNRKNRNDLGIIKIYLNPNLKIYDYNEHHSDMFGITRLNQDTIKNLQEQGYDLIKGKVLSKTEYILLNKDKITNMEFIPIEIEYEDEINKLR